MVDRENRKFMGHRYMTASVVFRVVSRYGPHVSVSCQHTRTCMMVDIFRVFTLPARAQTNTYIRRGAGPFQPYDCFRDRCVFTRTTHCHSCLSPTRCERQISREEVVYLSVFSQDRRMMVTWPNWHTPPVTAAASTYLLNY